MSSKGHKINHLDVFKDGKMERSGDYPKEGASGAMVSDGSDGDGFL